MLYKNGEKLTVDHESIMPDYVVLEPAFLESLPVYHKKSALLDAFCQSAESLWANGKTTESKAYALSAIKIIFEDTDGYLANDSGCALRMLQAANLSGKAINISRTTAAHAMSYKLSAMFGVAHGHAVALCLQFVWAHLLEAGAAPEGLSAADYGRFMQLFARLDMRRDFNACENKISELAVSVNVQRLSNHPVELSLQLLADMYRKILCLDVT